MYEWHFKGKMKEEEEVVESSAYFNRIFFSCVSFFKSQMKRLTMITQINGSF